MNTPQVNDVTSRLELGRWIADQRDHGASWIDVAIELNTSEPVARALEKQFLDHIADRERELQHALW